MTEFWVSDLGIIGMEDEDEEGRRRPGAEAAPQPASTQDVLSQLAVPEAMFALPSPSTAEPEPTEEQRPWSVGDMFDASAIEEWQRPDSPPSPTQQPPQWNVGDMFDASTTEEWTRPDTAPAAPPQGKGAEQQEPWKAGAMFDASDETYAPTQTEAEKSRETLEATVKPFVYPAARLYRTLGNMFYGSVSHIPFVHVDPDAETQDSALASLSQKAREAQKQFNQQLNSIVEWASPKTPAEEFVYYVVEAGLIGAATGLGAWAVFRAGAPILATMARMAGMLPQSAAMATGIGGVTAMVGEAGVVQPGLKLVEKALADSDLSTESRMAVHAISAIFLGMVSGGTIEVRLAESLANPEVTRNITRFVESDDPEGLVRRLGELVGATKDEIKAATQRVIGEIRGVSEAYPDLKIGKTAADPATYPNPQTMEKELLDRANAAPVPPLDPQQTHAINADTRIVGKAPEGMKEVVDDTKAKITAYGSEQGRAKPRGTVPDTEKAQEWPVEEALKNPQKFLDEARARSDRVLEEMQRVMPARTHGQLAALMSIPGAADSVEVVTTEDGRQYVQVDEDRLVYWLGAIAAAYGVASGIGGRMRGLKIRPPRPREEVPAEWYHPSPTGVTTKSRSPYTGRLSYLRGGVEEPIPWHDTLVDDFAAVAIPEYDGVRNADELRVLLENMTYLKPEVIDEPPKMKVAVNPETGLIGNAKTAYPTSEETIGRPLGTACPDNFGCARTKYATINGLAQDMPCYGGSCYAATQGAAKGHDVATGAMKIAVKGPLRDEILDYIRKHGVEAARNEYRDITIKEVDDATLKKKMKEASKRGKESSDAIKYSIYREKVPSAETYLGAAVSKKIKPNSWSGLDVRIGMVTDGGAWVSDPEVLDAVLAANPRTVWVFSSGYHTPPPPHELSRRSVIDVTVSGWHPLPETLHRLRYAVEARKNGWNVVLRFVTADPNVFTNAEAQLYNRIWDAIHKTDFVIMQQPLHRGSAYGNPIGSADYPACCVGSKKFLHTCHDCQVVEGVGPKSLEFHGIEAGKRDIMPDYEDIPEDLRQRYKFNPKTLTQAGVGATVGALTGGSEAQAAEGEDRSAGDTVIDLVRRASIGAALALAGGAGLRRIDSVNDALRAMRRRWDEKFAEPIISTIKTAFDHSIRPEWLRREMGLDYHPQLREMRRDAEVRAALMIERARNIGEQLLKLAPTQAQQKRLMQVMRGGVTLNEGWRRAAEEVRELFNQLRESARELELLNYSRWDYITRAERANLRKLLSVDIGQLSRSEKKELLKARGYAVKKMGNERLDQILAWEQDKARKMLWNFDHYAVKEKYVPRLYEMYEKPTRETLRVYEEEARDLHARMIRADGPEREQLEEAYYAVRGFLDEATGKARSFRPAYVYESKLGAGWTRQRLPLPMELQRTLRRIDEAAFPVAAGIAREGTDVSNAAFLRAIAENPEWAFKPARGAEIPTNYQVVSGREWGALNGMAVRKTVLDDLRSIIDTRSEWGKLYDMTLSAFRVSKTLYSPAAHMRNFLSNGVLAWINADLAPTEIGAYKRAIKALREKDGLYEEARKAGLFVNTFVKRELLGLRSDLEKLRMDRGSMTAAQKVAKILSRVHSVAGELYESNERLFKMAIFVKERSNGASSADAAQLADRAIFNYGDIPPIIRRLRRVFPFVTFAYKASGSLAEQAIRKPWKIGALFGMMYLEEEIAKAVLGINDEEYRKLRAAAPSWSRGRLFGVGPYAQVLTPFTNRWGDRLVLDLAYIVPYGTMGEPWQRSRIPLGGFSLSNPYFDVIASIAANRELFTGREITSIADDAADVALKYMSLAYRTFLPDLAPGGRGYNKLLTGLRNLTSGSGPPILDYMDRPIELSQAMLSTMLGVKLSPLSTQSLDARIRALRSQMRREIGAEITRLKKRRDRHEITLDEYIEKRKRLEDLRLKYESDILRRGEYR